MSLIECSEGLALQGAPYSGAIPDFYVKFLFVAFLYGVTKFRKGCHQVHITAIFGDEDEVFLFC